MEFYNLLIDGCERMGRTACPGRHLKSWVEEAGFNNVRYEVFKLPLGPWPKDQRLVCYFGLSVVNMIRRDPDFSAVLIETNRRLQPDSTSRWARSFQPGPFHQGPKMVR
jgi:hypothetical protein